MVAPSVFPLVTKNRRNVLYFRFLCISLFLSLFRSSILLSVLSPLFILWFFLFSNSTILLSHPSFICIASPSPHPPPPPPLPPSLHPPSLYFIHIPSPSPSSIPSECSSPSFLHTLSTFTPFFHPSFSLQHTTFNHTILLKQSMMTLLHPSRRLSLLSLLLGTLSLLTAMASAQAPASTYGMAYTTIDESTFYIQGGIILPPPGGTAKIASQFYALDFTQDWNATSPPWKALTAPITVATQISSQSITISPDRQTLTLWSVYPTVALNYSIADASWTRVPLSAGLVISGIGLRAAADPTTGAVYIPGVGPLNTNYLVRYNYLTGLVTLINIPLALVPALDSYSFVWCQPRKSFLLFAGNVSSVNAFSEYSPSTGQWNQLVCHTTTIRR